MLDDQIRKTILGGKTHSTENEDLISSLPAAGMRRPGIEVEGNKTGWLIRARYLHAKAMLTAHFSF